jgi:hypothetical protein
MRLLNCCAVALILAGLSLLAGCAGREAAPQGPTPAPLGLKLTALADPALDQPAPHLELGVSQDAAGVCVTISGRELRDVRSMYFELEYDPARLDPLAVVQSGLEAKGEVLALSLTDCPGRVRCGQVLVHPQRRTGLSGAAQLARVSFACTPCRKAPRTASAPPGTNASKALPSWDAPTSTLSWGYCVNGDYNQDGAVAIVDLTPLGMHFGEQGPFPATTVQSVIDSNADQKLNAADLTAIGVNYGHNALGGYVVFESTDPAKYPQKNTDPPVLMGIDGVPLNAATGNPALERLRFSYQFAAPAAQAYYFVRPSDDHGDCGSPSYTVSGNAAQLPTLSVANPPAAGNGTSANPYIVAGTETYQLQFLVPGVGDASLHSFTKYFISDPGAGALAIAAPSPTLTVDPEWVGNFSVNAAFQNTQAASPIYFHAKPPYTMLQTWVDQGNPASVVTGEYCSLANIGGEPAVAYYEQTTGTLHYAYYTSGNSTWHASSVDNAAVVGKHCSLLALSNGCPAIAYMDQTNSALKVASATKTTPDGPGDWVAYTAGPSKYPIEIDTHLVNGTMAVVFNDALSNQLWYTRTYEDFPDDITDWVWHPFTGAGDQASPSLEWVDGVPAIAYYDADAMDLRYCYGKNFEPHSSDGWVKMAVDSADAVGLNAQLYAMDGSLPVIAYFDWTHGDLKFAQGKKSKPLSAADWTLTYIDRQADMVGTAISMDTVNGHLCLAYKNYTTDGMWFARNKTPYPAGPQSWQTWEIDSGPGIGDYLSLTELYGPVNGVPGIAYFHETEGNLGYIKMQ